MAKLIAVTSEAGYKLELEYDDGVKREADLSHLVGKGVFAAWNDPAVFAAVTVGKHGEIRWTEDLEFRVDAMYLHKARRASEASHCVAKCTFPCASGF